MASDDCIDPNESILTMIWILSNELATITFGHLRRQSGFNQINHTSLLCLYSVSFLNSDAP